jgi:acetoacetate decarboxylase
MHGPYQVYYGGGINPPHAPAIPLEWYCPEHRNVAVTAEVDEATLREILSYTPFEYVTNRARFAVSYLKGHTLTTPKGYFESAITVPVRYRDLLATHIIYMYCDNATAILAGRDVFGMPKKDADIALNEDGGHKWGRTVREGVTLFEVDFNVDPTAPDVPLVDGQEVSGSVHVRRVPLIDRPGDAYRDVTYRDTKSKEIEKVIGRATLKVGESNWDPIYKLNPQVLGAVFSVGSFGGYFRDETRKILDRWMSD